MLVVKDHVFPSFPEKGYVIRAWRIREGHVVAD